MRRAPGKLRDFYEILDVPLTASFDEIKRAYRRLAKKYHPDVSSEENAEEHFKDIQQAYSTLKNPIERGHYDQMRAEAGRRSDFEPEGDAYRYWQSPPPVQKTVPRKVVHACIILFWMLLAFIARLIRIVTTTLLSLALGIFHTVFPFVAFVLIVAGLIFDGNPFVLATWSPHPQLTFMCFGLPVAVVVVAVLAQFLAEWLSQPGPLFPSLQTRMNAWRYRTLYF